MIFPRLHHPHPISKILERQNFRTLERSCRRYRAGMTMIELVAALALCIVIFGILLIALNTASDLWSNSRAQRRELPSAQRIADLIADDLYQAIVDISPVDYPPFRIYSTTNSDVYNPDLSTPSILLTLARPASPSTFLTQNIPQDPYRRISLDAVYYTSYSNALFRLVFPLYQNYSSTNLLSVGELIAQPTLIATATDVQLHLQTLFAPFDSPPPISITLLAERIIPVFRPDDYENTKTLPSSVFFAMQVFDQPDWQTYLSFDKNDDSPETERKRSRLGTALFHTITPPQAGGSRLP